MNDEFSARRVATQVVTALEARRDAIADDPRAVEAELEQILAPLRASYRDSALPPSYFAGLEEVLRRELPARWQRLASAFSALERRGFGSWRGGDVYARVVYLLVGLLVGGLCVEAPFIPIWEKWFPFAVAAAAWWLPDAQAAWHRRRHARALGAIVQSISAHQGELEGRVSLQELEGPPGVQSRPADPGSGSKQR